MLPGGGWQALQTEKHFYTACSCPLTSTSFRGRMAKQGEKQGELELAE